ncbi:hypothetical protein SAMN04487894_13811, partial [Niabella drilacis]
KLANKNGFGLRCAKAEHLNFYFPPIANTYPLAVMAQTTHKTSSDSLNLDDFLQFTPIF